MLSTILSIPRLIPRKQNLGFVTREDLAEVADVTDRVDQINVRRRADLSRSLFCAREAYPV